MYLDVDHHISFIYLFCFSNLIGWWSYRIPFINCSRRQQNISSWSIFIYPGNARFILSGVSSIKRNRLFLYILCFVLSMAVNFVYTLSNFYFKQTINVCVFLKQPERGDRNCTPILLCSILLSVLFNKFNRHACLLISVLPSFISRWTCRMMICTYPSVGFIVKVFNFVSLSCMACMQLKYVKQMCEKLKLGSFHEE